MHKNQHSKKTKPKQKLQGKKIKEWESKSSEQNNDIKAVIKKLTDWELEESKKTLLDIAEDRPIWKLKCTKKIFFLIFLSLAI